MSAHFFKSTFSGSDRTCVEVAHRDDTVLIRDSKHVGSAIAQPIISIAVKDWPAVLELALNRSSGTVRNGLTVTMQADGGATLRDDRGVELVYNVGEWDAFAKGVADGQFTRH